MKNEFQLPDTQIVDVVEQSDKLIDRLRVNFKNGYWLSIVRGMGTYGGDEGLFEIMPSDKRLIDDCDAGDSVVGYLTADRVRYYVNKIASAERP